MDEIEQTVREIAVVSRIAVWLHVKVGLLFAVSHVFVSKIKAFASLR
jgi:hypothetical protein